MEQSTAKESEGRFPAKKAYAKPSLVVYGSITKLTQDRGGSGVDGGVAGMNRLPV